VELEVLAGREVEPVLAELGGQARRTARPGGRDHAAWHADADHEHVVLQLRADAPRLQGVALLRAQPVVAVRREAGDVDGQAGALRRREVGQGHVRRPYGTMLSRTFLLPHEFFTVGAGRR
jgi:hypothetical protein